MDLVEFGELTEAQRTELHGDEQDPWDAWRIPPLQWRAKDQHVGLTDDRGRLVANAGMLVADVEAGGRRFPVVGIGGVIVNARHRGRGLSLEVIRAALEKARTLGPDFALLFCHDDRVALYRRFGFELVASEVLVEDRTGQVEMPMRTMWRALRPGAGWPRGRVVVYSLPF
jgi:predicted N-acetyltransferase YhbS